MKLIYEKAHVSLSSDCAAGLRTTTEEFGLGQCKKNYIQEDGIK